MSLTGQPSILPESRCRDPKGVTRVVTPYGTINMVPMFCASCQKGPFGLVPEDKIACNFSFYVCDACEPAMREILNPSTGYYMEPDVVFWQKVKDAQIEEDGRELTTPEVIEALKDSTHYLAKLAKDRDDFIKRSRA